VIRIFPRRTQWTPRDDLAFVGDPTLFRPLEQPVRISVAFKWDIPEAERLYRSWKQYYSDIDMGGPALGSKGGEFVAGRFLKPGITITSRGCPNRCWFCSVHERDPEIIELPIVEGWNVVDDNILATSDDHYRLMDGESACPGDCPGHEEKRVEAAECHKAVVGQFEKK